MKPALFALWILSSSLLLAQTAKLEEVGKSPVEARFAPGGQIRVELCSSGVELRGTAENLLRVSYHSEQERTADVRVRLQTSGDEADLRVSGCPHNNFQVTIELPRSSNLRVRMFAGDLQIRDVTGDKDVVLHAGQLTMDVGDPATYSHVHASVNTGDLEAEPFNVSKGGLFRSFERSGSGKYRLYAHVGAGELDLR